MSTLIIPNDSIYLPMLQSPVFEYTKLLGGQETGL
jgi:hypothetical protein